MNETPGLRLALIETSHRSGWVALARGTAVLAVRPLEEARRHARDLAPLLAELLAEQGWQPRELGGVIVSRGPGSYTGLRVGIMSAKTLAYAVGCPLAAVDTFNVIAAQAQAGSIDVIADAQQERIYVQRFQTTPSRGEEDRALRIVPFSSWLPTLPPETMVSGPGLEIFAARLPPERLIPEARWLPQPAALLKLGLDRLLRGEQDDPFLLEPLYLRPSSAEEKWQEIRGGPTTAQRP